MTSYRLPDPAATERFGCALAGSLRAGDVVALFGPLGVGKTSLCRGILRGLGFTGDVASPTFPIVLAYTPPETRLQVLHVDLYRVENPGELAELGLDDALSDGALLIEWPERLPRLWPHALGLALADHGAGGRSLTVTAPSAWEGRCPPR